MSQVTDSYSGKNLESCFVTQANSFASDPIDLCLCPFLETLQQLSLQKLRRRLWVQQKILDSINHIGQIRKLQSS